MRSDPDAHDILVFDGCGVYLEFVLKRFTQFTWLVAIHIDNAERAAPVRVRVCIDVDFGMILDRIGPVFLEIL